MGRAPISAAVVVLSALDELACSRLTGRAGEAIEGQVRAGLRRYCLLRLREAIPRRAVGARDDADDATARRTRPCCFAYPTADSCCAPLPRTRRRDAILRYDDTDELMAGTASSGVNCRGASSGRGRRRAGNRCPTRIHAAVRPSLLRVASFPSSRPRTRPGPSVMSSMSILLN